MPYQWNNYNSDNFGDFILGYDGMFTTYQDQINGQSWLTPYCQVGSNIDQPPPTPSARSHKE